MKGGFIHTNSGREKLTEIERILNTYFIERDDYNDEKNELQFEGKA